MNEAYVGPTYYPTQVLSVADGVYLNTPTCSLCGAGVANERAHTEWHAQLWVVLSR